jgi:CHAT domain-containing protein/uncharacterized protein HemY
MPRHLVFLFVILNLSLSTSAQVAPEPQLQNLVPGQPDERQISGGEKHTYQIKLTKGEFLHAVLDQVAIDLTLTLVLPDGKQLPEVDLNRAGDPESLSAEANVSGEYRLIVRALGSASIHGSYSLRLEMRDQATAEDSERIAIERLMLDIEPLLARGDTSQQALEKSTGALAFWRKTRERFWEARTLFDIAFANLMLYRYEKAVEYFEQGLAIAGELKDPALQARLLRGLGYVFRDTNRPEQALDCLSRAVTAAREAQNLSSEAASLNLIGNIKSRIGRTEEALGYHERALVISREIKDRSSEAGSLNELGNAQMRLSRYEKASEYYEQALAIYRELKDRPGEGSALVNVGSAYYTSSHYEKAVEYYEQALVILREVKNRNAEGIALINLAMTYSSLSRQEKVIEYSEQALVIAREIKDRYTEGYALNRLGSAYFDLSRYEKAIEYYEQSLVIAREVKNRKAEGDAFRFLGDAYSHLGHYDKAVEYVEQALVIDREIKNRNGEGYTLNNLGIIYMALDRYEKAIENLENALLIFREVKDRPGQGKALLNLGLAYRYLGRYEKAIEYYEQSLAVTREAKDRLNEGWTLNDMGSPYRLWGQPQKAIEHYEQALAIAREIKNRSLEANVLDNLGLGHNSLHSYKKAIEYFEQALAIYRETKERVNEGIELADLGNAYRLSGRAEKAIDYYQQALSIHREVKDQLHEADTLNGLAQAERSQGNLNAARNHIEQSLQIAESLRAGVVSPESRTSFLATVQESYQLYTDLLMQQHRFEPSKGFDALAVETSERQRARSLLDLLSEAHADVRQGVDAALVERERSLGQQLENKAQLLARASKSEQVASLKQEISQLEIDYERAQTDIRKASPHYAALTQPQPLKLKEIQQQLDPDTLLLEYALGGEQSYLWAITKDSLSSYELPKEEEIKQSAVRLNELLTARASSNRGESAATRQQRITEADAKLPAAASELSHTLLGPVASRLGSKRMVIVADGALQYIPFAMLPEPSLVSSQWSVAQRKRSTSIDKLQPLIVNHEVVSLPSASALAIQRAELAGRQPAPKLLAVIADPVFDRADNRVQSLSTASDAKQQMQPASFTDTRIIEHLAAKPDDKAGVAVQKLVIARLPFTRQEANQLLALAPKTSSFSAVDFQANRATVLSGELSQYRYVHFATHGWLDSERPGLSALVLSMVDQQGKPEDGFLRANDVYNLKLPAELVVLSACQTGLGKEIKGEGVVGLTRGFMYAGAARVVVSLWNVNDKATADLMTKFYEKMLKQQERPAAALRAAQVEMWRQKQWHSPYYWAPFTMQGEWR